MIRSLLRFRQPILAAVRFQSSFHPIPYRVIVPAGNVKPKTFTRSLSTENKSADTQAKKEQDAEETKDIVLTPGEQVVAATRLGKCCGYRRDI